MVDNKLGEFLRARRELTSPQEHGLPVGRRRVPGLRREEVAMLAGISAEYYIRLERGRDRHPSAQVVEALARVLFLDAESTAYLGELATDRPRIPRPERRDGTTAAVQRLLASLTDAPAVVLDPFLAVLAHNRLAALLHGSTPPGGGDMLRDVFLDPTAPDRYPDWAEVAAETVASLRATASQHPDEARLIRVVGELSVRSPEFGRLWARHEVRAKSSGTKRMISPAVGLVELTWETLSVTSAPGQLVVAYWAEPGSESERRLNALRALEQTERS